MSALTDLTVAEIRDGFRAGSFSAREVAEVICAGCDPGRFARAQLWAEALAG